MVAIPHSRLQVRNWKPGPAPETQTLSQELAQTVQKALEARHVVVHCHFAAFPGAMIRIWKTTYLLPAGFPDERMALLHAENISIAPQWTAFEGFGWHTFTLIFEGLPSPCTRFDLSEDIAEPGRFFVPGIVRNARDVYHLWL